MKKKSGWIKKVMISDMKRIDGVKRWEMAAEMWHTAKEFAEMGRKANDAKRLA